MKKRMDLAYPVNGDDCRAGDAEELLRIKLGFEGAEGFAHEMGGVVSVDLDVVVSGRDVADRVDGKEQDLAFGLDGESIDGNGRRWIVGGNEGCELFLQVCGIAGLVGADRFFQSHDEAGPVEGFEEVVYGVQVESLERELVVGGDENDNGQGEVRVLQVGRDFDPRELRHLDVEENEVGLERGDFLQGACSV